MASSKDLHLVLMDDAIPVDTKEVRVPGDRALWYPSSNLSFCRSNKSRMVLIRSRTVLCASDRVHGLLLSPAIERAPFRIEPDTSVR